MWIFDSKGKRTEATEENAKAMVAAGGGFSCLWPRGTPGEEAFEFEALQKDPSVASAIVRAAKPRKSLVLLDQSLHHTRSRRDK